MVKTILKTLTLWLLFSTCLALPASNQAINNGLNPDVADSTQIAVRDSIQETSLTDSLQYRGDHVFYNQLADKLNLLGKAGIVYAGADIKADSIWVDNRRKIAHALGNISMKDGGQDMLGEEIFYSIDDQSGLIRFGATRFDKGFYYGDEIRKVGEDVFDISNGRFTTSDALYPEFWIWSDKMRIYRNHQVVAKPIVFYVNYIPVFALPYGTFTLKRGREPGFLVPSPDYNNTEGKSIKDIAYYYPYKDLADFLFAVDFTERKGWETRFDSQYRRRYSYDGSLFARYRKSVTSSSSTSYEWLLNHRHHQDIGPKTSLDLKLNFVSGKDIFSSDVDIDDRTRQNITSSFAYRQPLWGRTLSISGNYNDNLVTKHKSITLPSVSYSLASRPIYELFTETNSKKDAFYKNFSYSYSFNGVQEGEITTKDASLADILYKTKQDSTGQYLNNHLAGIKHSLGVSYSDKLWFLNVSEGLSYNEAWFDRDQNNKKLVRGSDWRFSSNANFSMYGVRRFDGWWISAIRHIITPSASFSYAPDFSGENDDFYRVGSVSLSSSKQTRTLNYSLTNKWQLKLRTITGEGEKAKVSESKLNEFFSVTTTASQNLEKDGKQFSDISHRLKLVPGSYDNGGFTLSGSADGNVTQDFYNMDVLRWNVGVTINTSGKQLYSDFFPVPLNRFLSNKIEETADTTATDEATTLEKLDKAGTGEKWNFKAGLSYAKDEETGTRSISLRPDLSLNLSKFWSVSYENYIDLEKKQLMSQTLTASRDLRSWQIDFRYTKTGSFWDFRLVLFNKKLPDALKLQTRDHKY